MCELNDLSKDIRIKQREQEKIKKDICQNIYNTFQHSSQEKIKIEHFILKHNDRLFEDSLSVDRFKLYIKRKLILVWTQYTSCSVTVRFFNKFNILEMQDFNDKFVEYVKEELLKIKNDEENNVIEMVALKSLT